jgi:hypothetical protein
MREWGRNKNSSKSYGAFINQRQQLHAILRSVPKEVA